MLPHGVLSLGWKVDVTNSEGYTYAHCAAMRALVERHGLTDCRVVLAVAARLAAANPAPLLELLSALPHSELLVWTGTGELPVSRGLISELRETLPAGRVNFDVDMGPGTTEIDNDP